MVLAMPMLAVCAVLTLLSGPGPVLVQVPYMRSNGRLGYHTAFRTTRRAPAEDPDGPLWTTRLGNALRRSGLWRLPVVFDVGAGRLTLQDARQLSIR